MGGGVAVGVVMDGKDVFIQLLSPSLPHKHSEDRCAKQGTIPQYLPITTQTSCLQQ